MCGFKEGRGCRARDVTGSQVSGGREARGGGGGVSGCAGGCGGGLDAGEDGFVRQCARWRMMWCECGDGTRTLGGAMAARLVFLDALDFSFQTRSVPAASCGVGGDSEVGRFGPTRQCVVGELKKLLSMLILSCIAELQQQMDADVKLGNRRYTDTLIDEWTLNLDDTCDSI